MVPGHARRPDGGAVRRSAIDALARLVEDEDADWILELYFSARGYPQYQLRPLVAALPPRVAMDVVLAKARDPDASVRHAALVIFAHGTWGEPRELLMPFAEDPDRTVRGLLRAHGVL